MNNLKNYEISFQDLDTGHVAVGSFTARTKAQAKQGFQAAYLGHGHYRILAASEFVHIESVMDLARSCSELGYLDNTERVEHVMANGDCLRCIPDGERRRVYEEIGYWVVMSFRNGDLVKAG